jgi:hypothetical protein
LALDGKPFGGFCVWRNFYFVSRFLKRAPQETLYIGFVFHEQ